MKQIYIILGFTLILNQSNAQSYEFGLIHNGGYSFSVVATPNFDATDTDISDIGFALMLPAGNTDVTNLTQFNNREWFMTEVNAIALSALNLGDGTRDAFALNLPPGQTILSHTSGNSFILVSFEVSNMPTAGQLEILSNSDPIALGLGGAIDSFYNTNIDNTSTQNYFNGITVGQSSFMFTTLSISIKENPVTSIYPNPTSEFINIKHSSNIKGIELYDITGKQVLKTKQTTQVKVSHLPNGVYLIRIYSEKGNMTKKLVIN